ncbi:trimeric intracellular cation channel type 1B.1 isoform X2 [Scaptodrosophila lebanonensis]|nr:trimeric intracellular cation channel type 1B.1 isoform X2 [Scaptodrosophila lebanonensis]
MMNTHLILKHFPNHILFRLLHYSLIAAQLRDEVGSEVASIKPRYAQEWQPFSLWLINMLLAYAGDIIANIMLGTLPLEPLCSGHDVLFCTLTWYVIFYCPFNLGYALARTATFRILATTITAISQVLLIDKGVNMAGRVYDNAVVPMIVIGTVMGSGAELLKPVASILINKCQHNNAAYVKLTT